MDREIRDLIRVTKFMKDVLTADDALKNCYHHADHFLYTKDRHLEFLEERENIQKSLTKMCSMILETCDVDIEDLDFKNVKPFNGIWDDLDG